MCNDPSWRRYITALVGTDTVLLLVAFALAALLRGLLDDLDVLPSTPALSSARFALAATTVIPGFLALFWLRGAYAHQNLLDGPEEYARVFSGCTYGILLVVAISYLNGSVPLISRGWLLLSWLLSVTLVATGRFCLRRVADALHRRGHLIRRVLIVGASEQGVAIAEQLHGPRTRGIEVVGFLDDFRTAGTPVRGWINGWQEDARTTFTVIGHPRHAQAFATEYDCDLLVVAPSALSWESQQHLSHLGEMSGTRFEVRLAPTHYDLTAGGVEPSPLGSIPLLRLQPARITGIDAALRGVTDVILAIALLAVTAPVLGWAVASARLRGIGPIFQHRPVLGQGGGLVLLSLLNPQVSERLLVRGIPALLAVVRGQLSLVGPRPVPVERNGALENHARLLLAVKPGLTGPWRLADEAASSHESVLADIWWVRNWTIWLHLFVLLQTARRAWGHSRDGELVRWSCSRSDAPATTEPVPSLW